MAILDFKEIPIPTKGPERDQFELFARELLNDLGFRIVEGPERGADAGRDIIAEEHRTGIAGETTVRWLVSCKHHAHSGDSVRPDDEPDIHDRVRTHKCQGFLGFYSTVPSTGLATKLKAATASFEVVVFDRERIERELLATSKSVTLLQRFFPNSLKRWRDDHPEPAKIFDAEPVVECLHCGKSLLTPTPHGILVIWTTYARNDQHVKERAEHLYTCCNGACDQILRGQFGRHDLIDGWEDLQDLIIPIIYIRAVMTTINQLNGGMKYSKEALESWKMLLLNLFPLVSRQLTTGQQERIETLQNLPAAFGGLDYQS
jgi:hypothetical protein